MQNLHEWAPLTSMWAWEFQESPSHTIQNFLEKEDKIVLELFWGRLRLETIPFPSPFEAIAVEEEDEEGM